MNISGFVFSEDGPVAISDDSNQAPNLNIGSYSALSDYYFAYIIEFSDPDADDVFTYGAANVPAWLTFNQEVGLLYGTPDETDVGSYDIQVSVADNHGVSDTQTITIEVGQKQTSAQFIESDAIVVWDPFEVVDDARKHVTASYVDGNASSRIAVLGVDLHPLLGVIGYDFWDFRDGLVYDGDKLRSETRLIDLKTGSSRGTLIDNSSGTYSELVDRLGSFENLGRVGANVLIVGLDNETYYPTDLVNPFVELGSIIADVFVVDGSGLPQPSGDTSGWEYTYIPLLDPTYHGVTKQRFIGSAANDDFYASESPDEFFSGNTGSTHDHLSYHAIAMRGIEVDFDAGIVVEDGQGNQDIFEPHKFGMDGSQFGDEFYGIDNERVDGNGGDDFYHSLIDGAEWFNLRVGVGADLIVLTTDLNDVQWKSGDVRLSPDALWGHGYYAENVNTQGGGVGTGELIALNGMGRYTDIVICRSDQVGDDFVIDDVTFYLGEYVDEPSDDAFFLDDAFSDRHAEADTFSNRIGQFERFTSMQTLYAGDGDDLIDLSSARYENQASAAVFGGTGNDILWGGDSSEMLDGGEGDDVIFGGMGSDILIGGPGADEFQFTATSSLGPWDFNPGEDSITVFRRPGVDDGLVIEINAGIISLGGQNFVEWDPASTIDPSLTINDLNISYEVI